MVTSACGRRMPLSITIVINICYIIGSAIRVLALELIEEDMMDTLGTDFGALTPGAVVTPRRYRLPPDWSRVGRAWLAWTASHRRGILVSTYRYFVTKLCTERKLRVGPTRWAARGGLMAMATVQQRQQQAGLGNLEFVVFNVESGATARGPIARGGAAQLAAASV